MLKCDTAKSHLKKNVLQLIEHTIEDNRGNDHILFLSEERCQEVKSFAKDMSQILFSLKRVILDFIRYQWTIS